MKYDGPKLLIVDGHDSHLSVELVMLARENNVHILVLPPHSSDKLQPLDIGVFARVKSEWKSVLKTYLEGHDYPNINKEVFAFLLAKVFDVVKQSTSLGTRGRDYSFFRKI